MYNQVVLLHVCKNNEPQLSLYHKTDISLINMMSLFLNSLHPHFPSCKNDNFWVHFTSNGWLLIRGIMSPLVKELMSFEQLFTKTHPCRRLKTAETGCIGSLCQPVWSSWTVLCCASRREVVNLNQTINPLQETSKYSLKNCIELNSCV